MGNRIWAFDWYQNRWPWMPLNGIMALFCVVSANSVASDALRKSSRSLSHLLMRSCFPVLCCTFFSFQRSARTARPILTLYGSNDVVQPRTVLLGVKMMSDITWRNEPQKPNKRGVHGHFQAKFAKIYILQYLPNRTADQPKVWRRNAHHQRHIVGGPSLSKEMQHGWRPPSWKLT